MATRPIPPAANLPKPIPIQGLVDAVFKKLDLNQNATISRAEMLDALGPAAKMPLVGMAAQLTFRALDTNRDGAVSKAEVLGVLNRLDTDHNGTLSATEIRTAGVELVGVLGLFGPPPPG